MALGAGILSAWLAGALPAAAAPGGPAVARIAGTGTPAAAPSGSVARRAPLDDPQAVAVDGRGDVAIADTGSCEVDVVAAHRARRFGVAMSPGHLYVVAGHGCSGHRPPGPAVGVPTSVAWGPGGELLVTDAAARAVVAVGARSGRVSTVAAGLDEPAGIATDAAGDLFIADPGDCRVDLVPRHAGTHFGRAMAAGHRYVVAGSGVCSLGNPSGPATSADLSAPVAVAVDAAGDLFITESGRDDVDEVPVAGGTYFGVPIAAGSIAPVVGSGSDNTFLDDGLPATSPYAELNDPSAIATDAQGDLFIADGLDRCVREVPARDTVLFGRAVDAGDMYTALGATPVSTGPGAGAGDGTRWTGAHLVDPTGVAVQGSRLLVADAGANEVLGAS